MSFGWIRLPLTKLLGKGSLFCRRGHAEDSLYSRCDRQSNREAQNEESEINKWWSRWRNRGHSFSGGSPPWNSYERRGKVFDTFRIRRERCQITRSRWTFALYLSQAAHTYHCLSIIKPVIRFGHPSVLFPFFFFFWGGGGLTWADVFHPLGLWTKSRIWQACIGNHPKLWLFQVLSGADQSSSWLPVQAYARGCWDVWFATTTLVYIAQPWPWERPPLRHHGSTGRYGRPLPELHRAVDRASLFCPSRPRLGLDF